MAQITQLPPSYPSNSAQFGAGLAQYLQQALAQQQQQQAIKKQFNDLQSLSQAMGGNTNIPVGNTTLGGVMGSYQPQTVAGLNAITGLFNNSLNKSPTVSMPYKDRLAYWKQNDPKKYQDAVGKMVDTGTKLAENDPVAAQKFFKDNLGMDMAFKPGEKEISIQNPNGVSLKGTPEGLRKYKDFATKHPNSTKAALQKAAIDAGVNITFPGQTPPAGKKEGYFNGRLLGTIRSFKKKGETVTQEWTKKGWADLASSPEWNPNRSNRNIESIPAAHKEITSIQSALYKLNSGETMADLLSQVPGMAEALGNNGIKVGSKDAKEKLTKYYKGRLSQLYKIVGEPNPYDEKPAPKKDDGLKHYIFNYNTGLQEKTK